MLYDRFSDDTKTIGGGETPSDPRDRRQFPRSKGACELYYQKERYELIDWSAGGCAVEGLTGLTEGEKVDVTLRVSGKRTALVQSTKARVIRVEKESVALKFLDLSIEERDLLLIAQGAFSDNVFVMDLTEEQIL